MIFWWEVGGELNIKNEFKLIIKRDSWIPFPMEIGRGRTSVKAVNDASDGKK